MESGHFPKAASEKLWNSLQVFLGRGPKGYRRSDERIREDICEALMQHPGIDASEFEVTVKEGVVTLKGTVPDRWMKRASEWVADRVSGVRDIRNELTLS
jgi:osmotically-inducible protein OsmY